MILYFTENRRIVYWEFENMKFLFWSLAENPRVRPAPQDTREGTKGIRWAIVLTQFFCHYNFFVCFEFCLFISLFFWVFCTILSEKVMEKLKKLWNLRFTVQKKSWIDLTSLCLTLVWFDIYLEHLIFRLKKHSDPDPDQLTWSWRGRSHVWFSQENSVIQSDIRPISQLSLLVLGSSLMVLIICPRWSCLIWRIRRRPPCGITLRRLFNLNYNQTTIGYRRIWHCHCSGQSRI